MGHHRLGPANFRQVEHQAQMIRDLKVTSRTIWVLEANLLRCAKQAEQKLLLPSIRKQTVVRRPNP